MVAAVIGDWGTSSLRLWAVDADGSVLAEQRSDEGMAALEPAEFEAVLRRHMAVFGDLPPVTPVLLCGMVGARQGWREASYASLPADVAAICGEAVRVPAPGLDVRILPGLAMRGDPARIDVMRGEETQLLGVLQQIPDLSGLVVMPGTHSKWVQLREGRVTGFETAMTGELYALLCRHSVLRYSVEAVGAADDTAFDRGLMRGLAAPQHLLLSLFQVRAATLLHGVAGEAAAAGLSGLLIGAEIGSAGPIAGEAVTLVASGVLAERYARGLRLAGAHPRSVDAEAMVRGGLLHATRQLWPERMERVR